MKRPGAIDPALSLRQTGRAPREIVVDHPGGVLQIEALAQEVGGNQDIGRERRRGRGRALGARCESADHLLAARGLAPEPAPIAGNRRHAPAAQPAHQMMEGRPSLHEHDRFQLPFVEHPTERF